MNIAYKCIKLYNINILILKGGYDAGFLKLLGALLTVLHLAFQFYLVS